MLFDGVILETCEDRLKNKKIKYQKNKKVVLFIVLYVFYFQKMINQEKKLLFLLISFRQKIKKSFSLFILT